MNSSGYAFNVDYFYETFDLEEELSVPEFEALIEPVIARAIAVVDGALGKTDCDKSDLDSILLAGGTSQIPLVKDTLEERFGCITRIVPRDLMWLIAKGAAIHHRDLMTRPQEATRLILGADLSLETYTQGRILPTILVPYHQVLPHTFVREFPVNAHASSVTIQLLSESGTSQQEPLALERRIINIQGLQVSRISVKVEIDRNRTIRLSVVNPKTGLPLDNVEIKGDLLSTSEEIKAARKEFGFQEMPSGRNSGNQRYAVGIDLGTTTCEVIVCDLEKNVFARGITEPQLSQVLIRENGRISVDNGEYNTSMEGYFSNFKVDIGTNVDRKKYAAHNRHWPPEILSAHLLATIWKQLHEQFGRNAPLTEAVITVPSDFSEDQTALVLNAARIAGIDNPVLLAEPVAAFLAYADTYPSIKSQGKRFVIFDFGGGTTDVCVVEAGASERIETLATSGNNTIGGKDLTQLIASAIVDRFALTNSLSLSVEERERLGRSLFKKADDAKVRLSLALMTGDV